MLKVLVTTSLLGGLYHIILNVSITYQRKGGVSLKKGIWILTVFVVLTAITALPAKAGMTAPSISEMGSYEKLQAYQQEKVNVAGKTMLAFLVPGLTQFQRENYLEGTILSLVEVGAFAFMFRFEEVEEGGNIYSALTVNWWMVGLVAANHLYSGISTYLWGNRFNEDLYIKYDVEKITFGIRL